MARVRGPISLSASSAFGTRARARPEVERHRHDALHAHPHVVIEVVRAGQDHLVAGLGDAHQGEAEGLVAARGDADLARRDRRRRRKTERWRCIVLAQCRQAKDRRVAVHRRVEQQLAQMAAQFHGRGIARHRLAEVDQGPVGGKGAAEHPALGFADGRGFDGGKPRIGDRRLRRAVDRARVFHRNFSLRMVSPNHPRHSTAAVKPSAPSLDRKCIAWFHPYA